MVDSYVIPFSKEEYHSLLHGPRSFEERTLGDSSARFTYFSQKKISIFATFEGVIIDTHRCTSLDELQSNEPFGRVVIRNGNNGAIGARYLHVTPLVTIGDVVKVGDLVADLMVDPRPPTLPGGKPPEYWHFHLDFFDITADKLSSPLAVTLHER